MSVFEALSAMWAAPAPTHEMPGVAGPFREVRFSSTDAMAQHLLFAMKEVVLDFQGNPARTRSVSEKREVLIASRRTDGGGGWLSLRDTLNMRPFEVVEDFVVPCMRFIANLNVARGVTVRFPGEFFNDNSEEHHAIPTSGDASWDEVNSTLVRAALQRTHKGTDRDATVCDGDRVVFAARVRRISWCSVVVRMGIYFEKDVPIPVTEAESRRYTDPSGGGRVRL
jgi:hypothetical protein